MPAMLEWLEDSGYLPDFPPIEDALTHPPGLLAAGGKLTPSWLLMAYRRGIFPWYSPGEPLLWWSPDPRMVLFPSEIRITRSLRKRIRNGGFQITLDSAFHQVIHACATGHEDGTWITDEMMAAYFELYQLGYAHSVEVWHESDLVGGLYGVALDKVFFGESMFSRMNDASKVALATFTRLLEEAGFQLIDCQMHTPHLESLGAREISRTTFRRQLNTAISPELKVWKMLNDGQPLVYPDQHVSSLSGNDHSAELSSNADLYGSNISHDALCSLIKSSQPSKWKARITPDF